MVNGKKRFSAECQQTAKLFARMCCLQCGEQKVICTFFCIEYTWGYWAFIIFPSNSHFVSQTFWSNLFGCLSSPLFSVKINTFLLSHLVTRCFTSFKRLLFVERMMIGNRWRKKENNPPIFFLLWEKKIKNVDKMFYSIIFVNKLT